MGRLVLRNVTIIACDTDSEPNPRLGSIHIDGGKIDEIQFGEAPPAGSWEGALVVDATGLYAVPGLVNLHAHLFNPGSASWPYVAHGEAALAAVAARSAYDSLRAGVTTIRELGSPHHVALTVKNLIEEELLIGPRIVGAGSVVTITGGHGHWMGDEADTPGEVVKAIRRQVKAGAGIIKFMASGGAGTPETTTSSPGLSLESMKAGVEEAASLGIGVAAHALDFTGIQNAVRAGVTSVEHGTACTPEIITEMSERGVALVSTLSVNKILDASSPQPGLPEWILDRVRPLANGRYQSFRMALDAGVKVGAGMDSGAPLLRHEDFVTELETMEGLGASSYQALLSATKWAGEILGSGDGLGQLVAGGPADVLLLRSDPLASISACRDIAAVLARGDIIWENGR